MSLLTKQLARSLSVHRSSPTRKLMCDPELPADLVEALWEGDDQQLPNATLLQEKDRCVVMRCDHPQGKFLFKSHNWGYASRSVRMLLREPSARRCASLSNFLIGKGIPTPRPRACLVRGFGPLSHRSYLLNDYVEGSSLFHCARSGALAGESIPGLARQLVVIWEQLIDAGISHNDLKPENFIVDPSLRLWIIDMEKVRFHRDKEKLRRRHLMDVERFLHIRTWRDQPDAAEIFRQELLASSLGDWLSSGDTKNHLLLREGYPSSELSSRISVAIIADKPEIDQQLLRMTIDSVMDLADEIALVEPSSSNGEFTVRNRITCLPAIEAPDLALADLNAIETGDGKLKHSWVLVLRVGECATPDLVRFLPEHLTSASACDALAVPIEECLSGHSTRRTQPGETRVFHRDRCQFSLRDGELLQTSVSDKTLELDAGIKRHLASSLENYVSLLNRESAQIATERFQQGHRARLLWGMVRAAIDFGKKYFLEGIVRSGWIGLQVAALSAVFVWIQEAKLWQLASSDRASNKPVDKLDRTAEKLAVERPGNDQTDGSLSVRDAA